jgi:tetratricopeptide (TPR) repeat protein
MITNMNNEMKKRIPRFIVILIVGLGVWASAFCYPGIAQGAEAEDPEWMGKLQAKVRFNPEDNDARLELARAYYVQAGFRDYFQAKSWLWTENSFRKTALHSNLPQVSPKVAQSCRRQLLTILDRDPGAGLALAMAGDYHDYYNQKEIALWYYRQAVALQPDSTVIQLALADFYLSEWQPAKVLELLSKSSGPDVALRKGVAWLQSGEYQLALGYLLQADLLPPGLVITRDLNLCKIYGALGDYRRSQSFTADRFPGMIPGTLSKEFQGWSGFFAGAPEAAERYWSEGVKLNPDYYFWQSNRLGAGNGTLSNQVQSLTNLKRNNYLQSVAWIQQGQIDMRSDSGTAYRDFLAAIKADQRSLRGFLAAGQVAFQEKEYEKALDLLNQGLAVNGKFGPLLSKRADVYEALGRFTEAEQDREAAGVSANSKPDENSPFRLVPSWQSKNPAGAEPVNVVVQGNPRDLAGFWVSGDGKLWDWHPYWGGPVRIPGSLKQSWWLPVGPGLSGRVYYLGNLQPNKLTGTVNPPRITEDKRALAFSFPVPVKLVVSIERDASTPMAYVAPEWQAEHAIPVELFTPGKQTLDCWFQAVNGGWNRISFHVNIPGDPKPTAAPNQSVDTLPDDSTEAIDPPQLFGAWVGDEIRQGYPVFWNADRAAESRLWYLSDGGVWGEIPNTVAPSGYFTALVPETAVFVQIALKSLSGGAWMAYPVPELNQRLAKTQPCRFIAMAGSNTLDSRNVMIQPELSNSYPMANPAFYINPQLQWSLSNDLRIWSPWYQGFTARSWRLKFFPGQQLVYVRYKISSNSAPVYFTAIPVVLDTEPGTSSDSKSGTP